VSGRREGRVNERREGGREGKAPTSMSFRRRSLPFFKVLGRPGRARLMILGTRVDASSLATRAGGREGGREGAVRLAVLRWPEGLN